MNRRVRPVVSAASVALASTAAGIAVNMATDKGGSPFAWVLVLVCTVVLVVVTALVETLAGPPDDSSGIKLVIEADGRRVVVRTDQGVREVVPVGAQDAGGQLLGGRDAAGQVLGGRDAGGRVPVGGEDAGLQVRPGGEDSGFEVPQVVRVALVTWRRAAGITRRLEQVYAVTRTDALDVRMHVDDDPRRRLEGLLTAHVAVLDDHCSAFDGDPAPLVGGLDLAALRDAGGRGPCAFLVVLACRDGHDDAHAHALSRSLDGPAVLLATRGAAPLEHRAVLLPSVLGAVGDLAGRRVTAAEVGKAVDGALVRAHDQRPQMDWGRWRVRVLRP